jgi:hypothetical protein
MMVDRSKFLEHISGEDIQNLKNQPSGEDNEE